MDKMSYPRGLINYTTESSALGKRPHLLRPRIIVYATILLLLCGLLVAHISQRVALDLDVIRDRNTLYRETNEGLIENVYTLKILNMDSQAHAYKLWAEGIDGVKLVSDREQIEVEAGSVYQMVVRLQADEYNLEARSVEVRFHLQALDGNHLKTVTDARFLGPGKP
jgi:polyferredoxin